LITNEGKNQIKRYLAGYVPYIAGSVALGIGTSAETLTEKTLQFEAARADINSVTYNFATNKLVFKGSLPNEFGGMIYEIGLFSSLAARPAVGSRVLTNFDSTLEDWRDASNNASAYATANSRIGGDSLLHTPAASGTQSATISNLNYDFSYNTAADKFSFAYSVLNTSATAVSIRFYTDSSNYYTFNLTGADVNTIGYKIVSRTKGSATTSGTPDWGKITQITITTTAGAGQADVEFDAIRIDNPNEYGLDNILVARKVLSTPVATAKGQPQDFEYSLDITL
jgi:hypothetical protein